MSTASAAVSDSIADDEILYRRIPASQHWYDPATNPPLSADAFRPRKDDHAGLSVSRAKYKTIEQAATGASKHGYYVAVLNAKDLRDNGVNVIPDPLIGDAGHALLPDLTYDERDTSEAIDLQVRLAERLTLRVEGPF